MGTDELRWRSLGAAAAVALIAAGLSVAFIEGNREPRIRALRARADAFVSAARLNANFGRARILRVDAAPAMRTYVRFRLNVGNQPVKHASLLLWSSRRSRLGYQVRVVRSDWTERGITYDNAPRPSSRFVASGPVRSRAWKAVNVTSLVNDGRREVSFAITTLSRDGSEFASRETGLHGPRLVVETEDRTTTAETETSEVPAPNR